MIGKTCAMLPAIITASLGLAHHACAQETAYGHITLLQTSLTARAAPGIPAATTRSPSGDSIAVTLDVPFVNSSETPNLLPFDAHPCTVTNGGYALDPEDPGIKLNESVLLSAYLAGKRVRLGLSGCVFNRPRIVSVTMTTSQN
jgi:hypothetical protein